MFILIGKTNTLDITLNTKHIGDRTNRLAKINQLIVEENGKIIGAFEVNTGHKNGNEIHVVYNNGVVKIYNKTSQKYITAIIARIPQIERYGIECTKTMKNKIKKHVKENLNYL